MTSDLILIQSQKPTQHQIYIFSGLATSFLMHSSDLLELLENHDFYQSESTIQQWKIKRNNQNLTHATFKGQTTWSFNLRNWNVVANIDWYFLTTKLIWMMFLVRLYHHHQLLKSCLMGSEKEMCIKTLNMTLFAWILKAFVIHVSKRDIFCLSKHKLQQRWCKN